MEQTHLGSERRGLAREWRPLGKSPVGGADDRRGARASRFLLPIPSGIPSGAPMQLQEEGRPGGEAAQQGRLQKQPHHRTPPPPGRGPGPAGSGPESHGAWPVGHVWSPRAGLSCRRATHPPIRQRASFLGRRSGMTAGAAGRNVGVCRIDSPEIHCALPWSSAGFFSSRGRQPARACFRSGLTAASDGRNIGRSHVCRTEALSPCPFRGRGILL
jgi:hypothetical protein